MAEALASLEAYKKEERQISQKRQALYTEIEKLTRALALAEDEESGVAAAALTDYAELLGRGYCIPKWSSGKPELNAEEEAWLEALARHASADKIRIAHTWFEDRGAGWRLIATIAPPRHDRSYGIPKPLSDPLWRQRFELAWGQRLVKARRRIAASQPSGRPRR